MKINLEKFKKIIKKIVGRKALSSSGNLLCKKKSKELTIEAVAQLLNESKNDKLSGSYFTPERVFLKDALRAMSQEVDLDASVADVCGGCGVLGLMLAEKGYNDFTLIDFNQEYLDWAKFLFSVFGLSVNTRKIDISKSVPDDLLNSFDVVCLLGWESFYVTYSQAVSFCSRILKGGGDFYLTVTDEEEWLAGNWWKEIEKWYPQFKGERPELCKSGAYIISSPDISQILKTNGFRLRSKKVSSGSRSDRTGLPYPQYLLKAVKSLDPYPWAKKEYLVSAKLLSGYDIKKNKNYNAGENQPLCFNKYLKILDKLKSSSRVQVLPFREFAKKRIEDNKIYVALRHDVDQTLKGALRCALGEKDINVSGTYFIYPEAPYYGNISNSGVVRNEAVCDYLKFIQDECGSEIGFHNCLFSVLLRHELDPHVFLRKELEYFRAKGINISGISSHGSVHTFDKEFGEIVNFEYFKNKTLDRRKIARLKNRAVPVGSYTLDDYELEYEANQILWAHMYRKPFFVNGVRYQKHEVMIRDVTESYSLMNSGNWFKFSASAPYPPPVEISAEKIAGSIISGESGKKIILISHPCHFFDE